MKKRRGFLVFAAVLGILVLSAPTSWANIINISGTQNGENSSNGGSDCFTACLGSLIDPVQYTVGPGTYIIKDAWNSITGYEPGALYDAWNFEAGNPVAWVWHWKVFRDDGSAGATIDPSNYSSYILADIDSTESFATENAAAVFGSATSPVTLTFASTTTLDFVVNDWYLSDNAGGVSLDMEPVTATPEPPMSLMLLGTGLMGLGARYRGKKS